MKTYNINKIVSLNFVFWFVLSSGLTKQLKKHAYALNITSFPSVMSTLFGTNCKLEVQPSTVGQIEKSFSSLSRILSCKRFQSSVLR